MPRTARGMADDSVYHVLNRGNCAIKIFTKERDVASFVKLLEEARQRFDTVAIRGYPAGLGFRVRGVRLLSG